MNLLSLTKHLALNSRLMMNVIPTNKLFPSDVCPSRFSRKICYFHKSCVDVIIGHHKSLSKDILQIPSIILSIFKINCQFICWYLRRDAASENVLKTGPRPGLGSKEPGTLDIPLPPLPSSLRRDEQHFPSFPSLEN